MAVAQSFTPSLLPTDALSFGTSAGYSYASSDATGTLSADVFTPLAVQAQSAQFLQAGLRYGRTDQDRRRVQSFLGFSHRQHLGQSRTFGLNAYVEGGKRPVHDRFSGQFSLGAEYQWFGAGTAQREVTFGSNYYVPFQNYAAQAAAYNNILPRRGTDTFLRYARDVTSFLRLGSTFSLFRYPAAADLGARGYGTVSFDGTLIDGLPRGMQLSASVGGRFSEDEEFDPSVGLRMRHALPKRISTAQAWQGDIAPSSECRIEGQRRGINRLQCTRATARRPAAPIDMILASDIGRGGVIVPVPRRNLAYGTLFVPTN